MPYVTSPLSSRPIDSYLLRTHSDPFTCIPIVDSDTDNDATLLQCSQETTLSVSSSIGSAAALSVPSPSHSPRKMTAAMRRERDRHAAVATPATQVDDELGSDDDNQPLSLLLSRLIQSSLPTQSSSSSSSFVRAALSDRTNIVEARGVYSDHKGRCYQKKSSFYQSIRARFAHADDNILCRYCGVRQHTGLHHEDEFERAATAIPAPCHMTPPQLRAEVKRCTRKDGSVGLVSLCNQCHHEAGRRRRAQSTPSRWARSRSAVYQRSATMRNRQVDDAAKLARLHCECGHDCSNVVTLENLREFEWDHLVQKPDDPDYHHVSTLVSGGKAPWRCDRERAKCRLLHHKCHSQHSAQQLVQRRRAQR